MPHALTPRDYVARQLGAFFHFGVSTYTAIEWSPPKTPASVFDPTGLACRQWIRAAKAMHAGYAIISTKHHDGFCLWPSSLTACTAAHSPAKRDVVLEFV